MVVVRAVNKPCFHLCEASQECQLLSCPYPKRVHNLLFFVLDI